MEKTININGMACQNCARHVKEALETVNGVSQVSVDLEGKKAVVEEIGATDEALMNAVKNAGYTPVSIS